MTASVHMKVNTACSYRHSIVRVRIEKLQSTKLTIKTPERQNLRRFAALIVNFGQISNLILVLFFLTLNI